MKICGIICEYNPFHNGHLYHLQAARETSGADFVLCIMSGNFVQRGEAAALNKYTRARHAVRAGADAVIELPAVFSTSPAELFAKGAIKLLTAIPNLSQLCFGCESGASKNFLEAAEALDNEPAEVSREIKALMKRGAGYAKARAEAWQARFPDGFLLSPNNILGIEYARAVRSCGKKIDLIPVRRKGSGYSDETLCENFSSATAVRAALMRGEKEKIHKNVPSYVEEDLIQNGGSELEVLEKYALLRASAAELKGICDCREGLENALKRAAKSNTANIVSALTSKRYTASRLRRILLQNLLGISEKQIRACLASALYLNVLAIKKGNEALLSLLGQADYPLLVRAGDAEMLYGTAEKCYEIDRFADEIFALVKNLQPEKKQPFIE